LSHFIFIKKAHSPYYCPCTKPYNVEHEGLYWKKIQFSSLQEIRPTEYLSGEQPLHVKYKEGFSTIGFINIYQI